MRTLNNSKCCLSICLKLGNLLSTSQNKLVSEAKPVFILELKKKSTLTMS